MSCLCLQLTMTNVLVAVIVFVLDIEFSPSSWEGTDVVPLFLLVPSWSMLAGSRRVLVQGRGGGNGF